MHSFLVRHEKSLLAITRWLLLCALVTPLVFFSDYFIFPFITAKVFFFRSVILLALGGYLLLVGVNPKAYLPPRSLLILSVIVFFAWALVSAFFGVDWYRSIWSDHERMLGLFTMAHYVLFLVMLPSVFREEKEWRRVFFVLIGVGGVVALGALAQQFDKNFLYGGARAASTLGNPTYLSVYAGYIGFISVYLYLTYYRGTWRRAMPYLLISATALAFGAFVWSETRGAVVGLGVAVVWMCVLLALLGEKRVSRRIGIGTLLFVLAFGALVVFGAERGKLSTAPILRRFADFSITGTNETRLRTWGIALKAWREHPVFGWGWFNFGSAYDKHFEPEQLKHGLAETWVDQAHNTPLEMLTTTGIVGFVLYLALWAIVFGTLIQGYRRGRTGRTAFILMSGLLVFHFVQNIFVFDNPSSYLVLFVIFGWVIATCRTADGAFPRLSAFLTARRVSQGALLVVGAVVLLVYYTNVIPARANHLQAEGGTALLRGDAGVWWGFHQQALELPTPHRDDIRREMVRNFINTPGVADLPEDALDELANFMASEMKKNNELHPRDVRMALEYGELLMFMHEHLGVRHPDAAPEADRVYQAAMLLSPRRQQVGLLYANAVLAISDFQHARTILLHVRALSPSLPLIHRLLGEFFERAAFYEEAIASYEAAIRIEGAPERVFGSLDEWQRFGLLHMEHGNTLRGAWALDTVMACATGGRVAWRECAEGPSPHFASFKPSRKAFTALILYYGKLQDTEKADFYKGLAREYYTDFVMP